MEQIRKQTLWHPMIFESKWVECSTAKLDTILPSWERRRKELENNKMNTLYSLKASRDNMPLKLE